MAELTISDTPKLSVAQQFNLKEYEALRKEIDFVANEIKIFERYAVLASGAIWAWLVTQHNSSFIAWFLPIVLALTGFLRNWGLRMHLRRLAEYIRKIEDDQLRGSEIGGWEKYLGNDQGLRRQLINYLVWIVLVIIAVGALFLRLQLQNLSQH